jgi:hypothetical protein
MILSDAELVELTQKQRFKAQAKVLVALAIPYKFRPDGSIVVYREHVYATAQIQQKSPAVRLPSPRRVLSSQAG